MERNLWTEEYRLGKKMLDDDHIEICGILERFFKAIDDEENQTVIGTIFGELNGKLNEHFRKEEQFLLQKGYPEKDRKKHADGHLDVLYTLNHEYSNWQKVPGDPDNSRRLSNLCRWVWIELITADMEVKKKLELLRELPEAAVIVE
jgi:hemerythrin-like metal-binding protein